MLNKSQKIAVEAPIRRHLLIIAGAGTGKTRALTHRIAYLAKSGVPARKICSITFTNKAADELKNRVSKLLGASGDKIGFAGTFHSLGANILRREARHAKRTSDFVIFDEGDSASMIKKIIKTHARDAVKKGHSPFMRSISSVKSTDPRLKTENELEGLHKKIFDEYEAELMRHNAFDFDDLLHKTVGVFLSEPEVCKKYQALFEHILVDEYQDINDIQHLFIKLLSSSGASLSAVGDAEQTIYSFRGSNIGIFLSFPEHWKNPGIVTLEQNYRSTKTILGAASSVIANNRYNTAIERAKPLWTENEAGELVSVCEAQDEDDEALWICEQINSLTDVNSAILYRTNAQSRAIEQALISNGMRYRIYGGLKFYERREIKDIIAGLRLTLNKEDTLSRERLEKGIAKMRFSPYFNEIHDAPREPRKAISFFLEKTGYYGFLDGAFTNADERKENIEELMKFAEAFGSLPLFLERIALLQSTDGKNIISRNAEQGSLAKNGAAREVQLMTIHLAKGLEFDGVFVAGVNEGMLPHARSLRTEHELQEERRLIYVAMTRAKSRLYLSSFGIPSRFLKEIPDEFIKTHKRAVSTDDDFADYDYEENFVSL